MGADTANYAKLNGTNKYLGYPFAGDNGYVMFYNKTLAASAGITDMSNITMSELLTAAGNKGYEVDFPINNAFYAAGSLMSYNKGKSLYTLTMKSGGTSYSVSSTFNSDVGLKAAQQISGLFKYVDDGSLVLATESPRNGTLATIVDCSKVSAFKNDLKNDYDAAPLPFIDDTKTARYANYSGLKFYGINPGRATDHNLANAVAKFLVSEYTQQKRYSELKIKPTILKLLQDETIASEPHIKALQAQGKENTIPLTAIDSALWSQAGTAIKAIQKLGQSPADDDLRAILQELDDSVYQQ